MTVGKINWFRHLPCGSAGKESASNMGDLGLISRLGRSPGEGKGYPLQYSGLENSMDCIVHGRTDAEDQTPILWPPDAKNWLIGKGLDAGKNWRREERGMKDGWMASLTQWTWVWVNSGSWWWTGRPGMPSWAWKELDTTERLNWTELCIEVK